jgi:hypothetical protein
MRALGDRVSFRSCLFVLVPAPVILATGNLFPSYVYLVCKGCGCVGEVV